MALFNRKVTTAAFNSEPIRAAAGGASQIGEFYTYSVGSVEELALSIPTINRARDLLASSIACLDLQSYTLQWTGERYEEIYVPGESWMTRPDPTVTRNFIISQTVSDLFMYGRAMWAVTSRYANGFPATFQWLPQSNISTPGQVGPQFYGNPSEIQFNGLNLNPDNVVTFLSPTQGIIFMGRRVINTALRLDQAAERFASNEIAAGYLQQTKDSEPMTADELGELAQGWSAARRTNSIGALNGFVNFVSFDQDPSKLQITEGRQHSALELSRLSNIPAWILGIGIPGMTYQNAQDSRRQLFEFGSRPLSHAISERLSMNDVLPNGRHVKFDVESYLGELAVDIPVEAIVETPEREYR